MDYFLSMAISIILFTIKQAVKNPAHAAELKSALIKVRNQINFLYPEESGPLPPLD
jgi:hypothetical protein